MKNSVNGVYLLFGGVFAFIGTVSSILGAVILSMELEGDVWVAFIVFPAISVIFLGIGLFFIFKYVKNNKNKKRLLNEGAMYETEILGVHQMTTVQINGRYPYYTVHCQYKNNDGQTYAIKSGGFKINTQEEYDAVRARVWVNEYDPKDYYVEPYFSEEYKNKKQNVVDLR